MKLGSRYLTAVNDSYVVLGSRAKLLDGSFSTSSDIFVHDVVSNVFSNSVSVDSKFNALIFPTPNFIVGGGENGHLEVFRVTQNTNNFKNQQSQNQNKDSDDQNKIADIINEGDENQIEKPENKYLNLTGGDTIKKSDDKSLFDDSLNLKTSDNSLSSNFSFDDVSPKSGNPYPTAVEVCSIDSPLHISSVHKCNNILSGDVLALDYTPSKNMIVAGSSKSRLVLFNLDNPAKCYSTGIQTNLGNIEAVAFNPRVPHILAVTNSEKQLIVLDLRAKREVVRVNCPEQISNLYWSQKKSTALLYIQNGKIVEFDLSTNEKHLFGSSVEGIYISKDIFLFTRTSVELCDSSFMPFGRHQTAALYDARISEKAYALSFLQHTEVGRTRRLLMRMGVDRSKRRFFAILGKCVVSENRCFEIKSIYHQKVVRKIFKGDHQGIAADGNAKEIQNIDLEQLSIQDDSSKNIQSHYKKDIYLCKDADESSEAIQYVSFPSSRDCMQNISEMPANFKKFARVSVVTLSKFLNKAFKNIQGIEELTARLYREEINQKQAVEILCSMGASSRISKYEESDNSNEDVENLTEKHRYDKNEEFSSDTENLVELFNEDAELLSIIKGNPTGSKFTSSVEIPLQTLVHLQNNQTSEIDLSKIHDTRAILILAMMTNNHKYILQNSKKTNWPQIAAFLLSNRSQDTPDLLNDLAQGLKSKNMLSEAKLVFLLNKNTAEFLDIERMQYEKETQRVSLGSTDIYIQMYENLLECILKNTQSRIDDVLAAEYILLNLFHNDHSQIAVQAIQRLEISMMPSPLNCIIQTNSLLLQKSTISNKLTNDTIPNSHMNTHSQAHVEIAPQELKTQNINYDQKMSNIPINQTVLTHKQSANSTTPFTPLLQNKSIVLPNIQTNFVGHEIQTNKKFDPHNQNSTVMNSSVHTSVQKNISIPVPLNITNSTPLPNISSSNSPNIDSNVPSLILPNIHRNINSSTLSNIHNSRDHSFRPPIITPPTLPNNHSNNSSTNIPSNVISSTLPNISLPTNQNLMQKTAPSQTQQPSNRNTYIQSQFGKLITIANYKTGMLYKTKINSFTKKLQLLSTILNTNDQSVAIFIAEMVPILSIIDTIQIRDNKVVMPKEAKQSIAQRFKGSLETLSSRITNEAVANIVAGAIGLMQIAMSDR